MLAGRLRGGWDCSVVFCWFLSFLFSIFPSNCISLPWRCRLTSGFVYKQTNRFPEGGCNLIFLSSSIGPSAAGDILRFIDDQFDFGQWENVTKRTISSSIVTNRLPSIGHCCDHDELMVIWAPYRKRINHLYRLMQYSTYGSSTAGFYTA